MLLNSHISASARCFAGKVCGLVRSTWGTSGEDKLGARDRIRNPKVAHRACAGRAPGKHSPIQAFFGNWGGIVPPDVPQSCLCPTFVVQHARRAHGPDCFDHHNSAVHPHLFLIMKGQSISKK